ncbi:MAG: molybdopterin-dependent oxidoreductase [Actinomycetota bacterium]|nr:molybdopterin-dependent oxidoreductase [Actinomycetota bacterium]
MKVRLPQVEDFSDRLRGPETTSRVGVMLGIALGVCFLTGVWSHLQQDTPAWLAIPPNPGWLYRVTQGVHVISGTAAIPLLLVKLWSVFPKLFERPPRRISRELVVHGLERASIGVLVAAAIFQLVSGALNIVQWYPWEYSFRRTHYAIGWIAIGSLIVHIAVKIPIIRTALSGPLPEEPDDDQLSRRGLLLTAGAGAGLAVLLTAGQTVPWLRRVSLFAVRSGKGPQGLPVNRTARAAGALPEAEDPGFRLELVFRKQSMFLDLAALEALPQTTVDLPITCVEGWSAGATWTGVRMRDVAELVGAPAKSRMFVTSMQTRGAFATSELPSQFVDDKRTLLALRLNGETLSVDHGFPCRVIAPNRPGVLQTKWVKKLEVFG